MLMELTNLCLQVSSCKNKRQKLAHGDNFGSSDNNQISKETFSSGSSFSVEKFISYKTEVHCGIQKGLVSEVHFRTGHNFHLKH